MRKGEEVIILNDEQAYYVEHGGGNLPYMAFYQSKGGWPVFEMLETWQEAFDMRQRFALHGVYVQIFHMICFEVPTEGGRARRNTIPAPFKSEQTT
jgi:hypothetical protein